MSWVLAPIVVLIAVVVIAAAVWARAEMQRRGLIAAWAKGRGFTFSESHDSSFDARYPHFPCLQQIERKTKGELSRG